jgi:hypothetical protein
MQPKPWRELVRQGNLDAGSVFCLSASEVAESNETLATGDKLLFAGLEGKVARVFANGDVLVEVL